MLRAGVVARERVTALDVRAAGRDFGRALWPDRERRADRDGVLRAEREGFGFRDEDFTDYLLGSDAKVK